MTVDNLRDFGANVDEGIRRCVNNETFYLTMVQKALNDKSFDQLNEAVDSKDIDRAFEVAHALKGVLGNLALTPMFETVSEMVELLRSKTDTDYSIYTEKINAQKKQLEEYL
jgi:HPt (histidine-containing phosphotransfer) domain-containing protein